MNFLPSLFLLRWDIARSLRIEHYQVIIYTTGICPYCTRAKHLLQRKDIEFDEIRIDTDREQMRIMMERSRRHTAS